MTIHDELLWAITQKDTTSRTPLEKIYESDDVHFSLESHYSWRDSKTAIAYQMVPDIVATRISDGYSLVIEVENDIKWDFSDSLRQIKKYIKHLSFGKIQTRDFLTIIPKAYERFVQMYGNARARIVDKARGAHNPRSVVQIYHPFY